MEEHFEFKGTQNTWAARHNCFQLIYFEEFQYIDTAIKREKELKGWKRSKKEWLIQLKNPGMRIIKFSSKKRGSKY